MRYNEEIHLKSMSENNFNVYKRYFIWKLFHII